MNTKPEFDPSLMTPEIDPLADVSTDFPYQEIEGWGEPDEDARAAGLRTILQWMATPGRSLEAIGRRTLALLWVIDPGFFEGNQSLSNLARSYGIHKVLLSRCAREASKTFGISNAYQRGHDWKNHYRNSTREERRSNAQQKKGPRRSEA